MKELKKVNQLEPNSDLVNLNGEVCPYLSECPNLVCGCQTATGNSSKDDDDIIF